MRGIVRFTPVVQGSGVLVTRGRKFPIGEAAGRNASEPTSSLVKLKRRCRPSGQMGKADAAKQWAIYGAMWRSV
ncbi:hypothetical protein DS62_13990 [Smithella sp. SC_K08D17]|nr:hypothetical protein DS62_13990 [Smithella sp. SC_K08D17]